MSADDKHTNQSKERLNYQPSRAEASHANGESLLVKRTQEWVESTAKKLDILIGQIVTMATNPHWKVRLAMVKFARDLLFECIRYVNFSNYNITIYFIPQVK